MIGKTLSHYTVLEELSRGELQIVYRARDEKLNREAALKILPPNLLQEPERRQRFVQEATAAASLEHPHIGVIHEIGEADGVLFIAMELLRGGSLAERMEREPLLVTDALALASGIAQGLSYAHEHGIVHRDLKPGNVMLTSDGYPKLVDFGLAKLLDAEKNPFLNEAANDSARRRAASERVTEDTVSYMSPEQARGGKVDPPSEIFSFGLLLYHMLSGRPPFEASSRIDTLYAILHDETPTLVGMGADERSLLQPVVDRCLEKDPDKRYQSMSEVLDDLKRVRLQLESGNAFRPKRVAVTMGIGAAAIALLAIVFSDGRAPSPATSEKLSLAVLHFENLSGDPELEWLRTGITDMLVTDLSQSPEIEVLGTDRLYQILDDMDRLHRGPLPADSVRELARRASVNTVLRGSFAKAGESIRLSARLEDAYTGKVILSEKAEGTGQESVFRLVDELTGRIKANYSLPALEGDLDRDLRDVTTASVDAYRHYAEGIRLHERFREEEALPHFQSAVELDPGFAMALAKLGVVHGNLGMQEEADEYAEAALEHLDRLSERERHYIEGWCYSRRPETLERAVKAYQKAIDLYPDHGSARHNLGNLFVAMESYDDAIEQLEELRERGMLFPATYENLATAYKARGDFGRARAVLTEYGSRHPDDWTTVVALAELLVESGEINDGLDELDRAEALGASHFRTAPVRWKAQIFHEDWDDAEETALSMLDSEAAVEKSFGGRLAGVTALYRGNYQSVLESIDDFVATLDPQLRSRALLFKARLLLDVGDNRAALKLALTLDEDENEHASQQALLVAAIASARLGENDRADELADAYRAGMRPMPGPGPDRLYQLLHGELALARSDYEQAVTNFNEAESMLPPRGTEGVHTVIWYALATAHREAGDRGEAMRWYERIVRSTEERLFEPVRYVRSFYFLGKLHQQRGDDADAADSFERFLEYWEDGEIDRDRVREVEGILD
ncbi:MAG: hypothetical protein BMS9Abin37_2352 [Acidobacteriota bacterium]|nr:MAG: hypothetical protein BMS9Abin37_2352 [Acidobacteriota bacterium]